jgi:hypothetical protein
MNAGDNLDDINCTDVIADPNFDDVSNIVCSTIKAGGDPTLSVTVLQAVEDFLYPPAPVPTPTPAPTPLTAIAAITGTPKVGETLTVFALTPAGTTTTYQWWICVISDGTYAEISGATSSTYTLVAGDATKFIKVIATGTGNYTGTITSDATTVIANADQAAPTGLAGVTPTIFGGTNGKITGTTTAMEYKLLSGSTYIACLETETTGLAVGTYYVRYAAKTGYNAGTAAEVVVPELILAIGDSYGGGIVAYIFQDGDLGYVVGQKHGLIAATVDQTGSETGIIWAVTACQSSLLKGTSDLLGTGSANTDKIIVQNGVGSTYAAGLARAYNGGDHNDWFLPSKDELNKLWLNRVAIGGFVGYYYWSSSEGTALTAWARYFGDSGQYYDNYKYITYRVRAVRAF